MFVDAIEVGHVMRVSRRVVASFLGLGVVDRESEMIRRLGYIVVYRFVLFSLSQRLQIHSKSKHDNDVTSTPSASTQPHPHPQTATLPASPT